LTVTRCGAAVAPRADRIDIQLDDDQLKARAMCIERATGSKASELHIKLDGFEGFQVARYRF
jgi:hypothetical protein